MVLAIRVAARKLPAAESREAAIDCRSKDIGRMVCEQCEMLVIASTGRMGVVKLGVVIEARMDVHWSVGLSGSNGCPDFPRCPLKNDNSKLLPVANHHQLPLSTTTYTPYVYHNRLQRFESC